MQTRQLGNTDLHLTTVGVGTWAIGGGDWKMGWGDQDENDAVIAVREGIDLGINWIDTAAIYGGGRSEELVGQALKELGSDRKPIVATKCGRIISEDRMNIHGCITRESVVAECEASLKRLGVDVIDLYQIHWPDPDDQIEEGWTALRDLKEQGKIRYAAVSNFSVEQLERAEAIHHVSSLQPPYSMIARGIEDGTLAYCESKNIGIVCYSPMGRGLLSGAFSRERAAALPENDHRSRDPLFQEPRIGLTMDLVDGLKAIAEREGRSVAQLAIAWTLRHPQVTSAIVGARRPGQIAQTAPAGDWSLSNEVLAEVAALLQKYGSDMAAVR